VCSSHSASWRCTIIIGSIILGRSDAPTVYTLLRAVGQDRFASNWLDCNADFAKAALTLLDVPPNSPAAQAGLKRGDVVYAVGDPRPAIGEELLLRIAAAPPGSLLAISYFDGKSKSKEQTSVKTVAIQVSGN
jgi:hypothetical protein